MEQAEILDDGSTFWVLTTDGGKYAFQARQNAEKFIGLHTGSKMIDTILYRGLL